MADFCGRNSLLSAVSGISDILSYIITGICVVSSAIMMFLGSIYSALSIVAIFAGIFAISKKTMLPAAAAFSGVVLVKLMNFIFTVFFMSAARGLARFSGEAAALAAAYMIQLICIALELMVLALPTIMAWLYFAATLPPKVYQPFPTYNGQVPPQPYGQVPPVQTVPQNGGQQEEVDEGEPVLVGAAAQPTVPAAVQPSAAVQPIAPAAVQPPAAAQPPVQPLEEKYCTACGAKNRGEAVFCGKCGTKL